MTLQQFQHLDELDQVSAILEHGHLMAHNIEENEKVFLYRLDSFFVSACYSSQNDQLTDITCFLEVDQSVPHFRKQIISINPAERQYHPPGL